MRAFVGGGTQRMTFSWLVLAAAAGGLVVGLPLGHIAGRALRNPRRLPTAVQTVVCLATAALFALTAGRFGANWELLLFGCFAAAAVVLGAVDLIEKRLPNVVLYPTLIVIAALLVGVCAITAAWMALLGALCAGAGLFALYFLLAVISPTGIGMGDVKLAALIGLVLGYLGWVPLLVGGTAGFIIGSLTSVIALISRRATLKTALPFGPAMLAGAFVGILFA